MTMLNGITAASPSSDWIYFDRPEGWTSGLVYGAIKIARDGNIITVVFGDSVPPEGARTPTDFRLPWGFQPSVTYGATFPAALPDEPTQTVIKIDTNGRIYWSGGRLPVGKQIMYRTHYPWPAAYPPR